MCIYTFMNVYIYIYARMFAEHISSIYMLYIEICMFMVNMYNPTRGECMLANCFEVHTYVTAHLRTVMRTYVWYFSLALCSSVGKSKIGNSL